jgi:DNA replication protein DnaC
MLIHQTIEKIKTLKLFGMAKALEEQQQLASCDDLGFEERLGLLIDREQTERESRRLQTRLRRAKLSQAACLEDLDWKAKRGLDKSLVLKLSSCEWIASHLNLIVTGPTGVGKTYAACALAHKACQEGYSAEYRRIPRLFPELGLAKGDGSYGKLLLRFAKTDVLILDDWGLAPFTDEGRRDLLEILEDRHGKKSTLITSQLPIPKWHEAIGDPTLADAIMDRLVHNAYKIALKGESMRKSKTKLQVS